MGVAFTLCMAGVVLTGAACRSGDLTEPAELSTAAEPRAALAGVTPLAFRQVSTGYEHSCGVTTDGRAYCWGNNVYGQLGDGTTTFRVKPVLVLGGLTFRQVDAGGYAHTCGLTTDYRAYCWGFNGQGQVGDGTLYVNRLTPVPVTGNLLFIQVSAGFSHGCALTYPDRRAYCWGENSMGTLGDGTNISRLGPVAVSGARRFRQVSPGHYHTCGVTPTNQAWCWGLNSEGQLGDGTWAIRFSPVQVYGGYQFKQLDAGGRHTCAVTTEAQAYCWGFSGDGELGIGTTSSRPRPRPVEGGLSFERVSASEIHTCGETTLNRAYCWGSNGGQLGNGTSGDGRFIPGKVTGGLFFSQVSAGGIHTCARTSEGRAYCWGNNSWGQIGDGTTRARLVPVRVVGP